jgi:hypothetical protein
MLRRNLFSVAALLLASFGSAFGQTGTSMVRVVHLSPDAPAVDVLAGTAVLFTGIPYKGFTDYNMVPAGNYTININVAGTNTTAFTKNITVPGGIAATVWAVGNITRGPSSRPFDLVVTVDDRTAPAANQAKVRVLHAAPAAPNVDVYVTSPYTPIAAANATTALGFGAASPYLTVPGGLYQGRLTAVGEKGIAAATGPVRVMNGTISTVIALNPMMANGPIEFLVLPE